MNKEQMIEKLTNEPIIAAVKNEKSLEAAIHSPVSSIFLLFGDILTIGDLVARIHAANKLAFVHIDLVEGLSSKEISVDFICRNTMADGIISTKAALTSHAKKLGMLAIRRFFLLDSMAFDGLRQHATEDSADLIEVLPALMPKMIDKIAGIVKIPVIAGGLVTDKEDVVNAISAGAIAVSTTNPSVWEM